jgi:chromosome segregation ATPase
MTMKSYPVFDLIDEAERTLTAVKRQVKLQNESNNKSKDTEKTTKERIQSKKQKLETIVSKTTSLDKQNESLDHGSDAEKTITKKQQEKLINSRTRVQEKQEEMTLTQSNLTSMKEEISEDLKHLQDKFADETSSKELDDLLRG